MTEVEQARDVAAERRPRGRHRAPDRPGGEGERQAGAPAPRFAHEAEGGFCIVCGSVWPCSRSSARAARGPAHALTP
ncbi:hypothetical protein [Kineosporia sp. A_224]|uniref:hypothetical protein n=1 Tax=Kineosporia sp. A_224 TaxID=1962180 RepID=UPI00117AF67A|nr:hypothetical protein [Kineosporia sp. A_224]